MFAHQEYLYLLLFLPVGLVFFIVRLKQSEKQLRSHIQGTCWEATLGAYFYGRRILKYFFAFITLSFLILALARFQTSQEKQEVKIKGAEIMILTDVSNSMLVRDMGGFSRLDVLKKEINKLIEMLSGQRMGLISFSGSSALVSPLTLDYSILKLFLKSLSPQSHIIQGTNFGEAFRSAIQAFKRGSALEPDSSSRVIILATDGEDNQKETFETIKLLAEQKIRVFTLGFGTQKGGMIPVYDGKKNKTGYKKDPKGDFVVSRFNEKNLKKIAHITGGAFYFMSLGGGGHKKIYADIQKIGEGAQSSYSQNVSKEWYQYFALLAFFFGIMFFLIGEKRKIRLKEWHSYLEKKI